MVQKIPPDPYKTETDAIQVMQLKLMSAIFFHMSRGGSLLRGVSGEGDLCPGGSLSRRGFSVHGGFSVQWSLCPEGGL